jgi:GT2 family glycosyltransferase
MEKEINRLIKMWDGFDRNSLEKIYSVDKPIISLVMLSWLRFDKLIKTLNHFTDTVKIPLNIALRIQGSEKLKKVQRKKIAQAIDKFEDSFISFREQNHGSGEPRWEMLQEAKKFNTPYIMFTDDDMLFPRGSIEAKLSILNSKKKLGACASWCSPGYTAWNVVGKNILPRQPRPPFDYVDAMGSATTIMKSKVFEKCDYDKKYYVGWGDFDLCMQLRQNNWKCAILALSELKAINDVKDDPPEYRQTRYNKKYAEKSSKRFLSKWGIKIGR